MELQKFYSMIDYVAQFDNISNSDTKYGALILPTQTEVTYDSEEYCDVQFLKDNNIPHVQHKRTSCIVLDKGSIGLCIKSNLINNVFISDVFSKALCNYLVNRGLSSVRTDNNDILVDEYKVASGAEYKINGLRYMIYQISVNQNIELIKRVCKKPMVKTPKGLADFGLATDEIIEFCEEFWKKY